MEVPPADHEEHRENNNAETRAAPTLQLQNAGEVPQVNSITAAQDRSKGLVDSWIKQVVFARFKNPQAGTRTGFVEMCNDYVINKLKGTLRREGYALPQHMPNTKKPRKSNKSAKIDEFVTLKTFVRSRVQRQVTLALQKVTTITNSMPHDAPADALNQQTETLCQEDALQRATTINQIRAYGAVDASIAAAEVAGVIAAADVMLGKAKVVLLGLAAASVLANHTQLIKRGLRKYMGARSGSFHTLRGYILLHWKTVFKLACNVGWATLGLGPHTVQTWNEYLAHGTSQEEEIVPEDITNLLHS